MMADIEKVLQELPAISEMLYQMYKDETDKESISVRYEQYLAVDGALDLLKEQKAEIELLKEYQKTVHCKDCKWSWCLNPNDESPFYVCRHPKLCNMRMSHEGNWYCGDGEPKDGEQA